MSSWCSGGVSSSAESTPVDCMCVSCTSGASAVVRSLKSGCRCCSCGVLRLLVRVPLGFPMSHSFRFPVYQTAPRHVEVSAPRRHAWLRLGFCAVIVMVRIQPSLVPLSPTSEYAHSIRALFIMVSAPDWVILSLTFSFSGAPPCSILAGDLRRDLLVPFGFPPCASLSPLADSLTFTIVWLGAGVP
eukprot:5526278-Pleurochrysis_carterae.AAC.1